MGIRYSIDKFKLIQKIRIMKANSLGSTGNKSNRRKNRVQTNKKISEQQQSLNPQQKLQVIQKLKNIQKNRFKNSFQHFAMHSPYPSFEEGKFSPEEWQNQKQLQISTHLQLISYKHHSEMVVSFTTMLFYTFTVWLGTVQFFFGRNKVFFVPSFFYIVPIILLVIDSLLNGNIKTIINQNKLRNKLRLGYKPFFCLLYLILKICSVSISSQLYWLLLELPCLYSLYSKASQFYQSFRVMTLSKKYEYHIKSFDLIFSLALLAHFIAIILFQITMIDSFQKTWISKLKIEGNNPLIFYIYSFYFGCTTILTVGYGDIVPANHIQIAVVCLIQLFGIAIFAYLISEIGYNLSNLRKDREVVEKDLSVLQKCREYYKIAPQTINKARLNLLNSQQAVNRLKPEEQNQLVMKLSEPLRQEVVKKNNLSIIKSSIFFLCRWSKHFQLSLANSLISALYMPGQHFIQPATKERIYIIRLGEVQFYKKQKQSKKENSKVIKKLKVDLKSQVVDNSFGYTDVIGKPTDLQAVSTDFTSAYFITKDQFISSLNHEPNDFEYYHEIKDRIQQSRFPEALQMPVLNSRKYHYSPLRACLIKRHNIQQCGKNNKRCDLIRNQRRNGKKQTVVNKMTKSQVLDKVQQAYITSMDQITLREQMQRQQQTKLSLGEGRQQDNSLKRYNSRTAKQLNYQTIKYFLVREKQVLQQKAKEYQNFYPIQNLEIVLKKYDNRVTSCQKSDMFSIKEIIKTVKEKFLKKQA